MFKAIGVGVASVLGVSLSAYAADLDSGPLKNSPAIYAPPAHSWAGLYVGGSVGYGSGEQELARTWVFDFGSFSRSDVFRGSRDLEGGIYGAHLGYAWQFGSIVAGLEASINGTDIEDCSKVCGGGIDTRTELAWYSTAVARLGYARGSWLAYGFGGLAWGRANLDAADNLPVIEFPSGPRPPERISDIHGGSTHHVGWTAGVGIEYAVNDRLSLRAEYAHVSLGTEEVALGSFTDTVATNRITDEIDIAFDVVKIGASYKLYSPDSAIEPLK